MSVLQSTQEPPPDTDLFVIGGGINGCGIARDAAGRGMSVCLAEAADLAQATSSASTKLFHGGLRYLEYFDFRLVRESLIERDRLLRAMPHISRPMRFVLPCHDDMRFVGGTPAARLLGALLPWMRGRRPDWVIGLGLWMYDRLGGRGSLPRSIAVRLDNTPEGAPLGARFRRGFEYSDGWVDDARLVALCARDAAERGGRILTRSRVVAARREAGHWVVTVRGADGQTRDCRARALVNAAGPWVGEILHDVIHADSTEHVRLVRGSHIVTRRLYDHDKCYFLQGGDGRIIFVIPYEGDFTLIGTTEADHPDPDAAAVCTQEEQAYLCAFASEYFARPVTSDDIVWTYSGVRPLYDDGAASATAATRDYVLKLDEAAAPLLTVFGGKITTFRRLAENAVEKLGGHFPAMGPAWTAGASLPGGGFALGGCAALTGDLRRAYPFLDLPWAQRLVRAYGTDAFVMLGAARGAGDLGQDFGATLSACEVRWLMAHEFAVCAEDVLWRRSKLGLRMSAAQVRALEAWMRANGPGAGGVS